MGKEDKKYRNSAQESENVQQPRKKRRFRTIKTEEEKEKKKNEITTTEDSFEQLITNFSETFGMSLTELVRVQKLQLVVYQGILIPRTLKYNFKQIYMLPFRGVVKCVRKLKKPLPTNYFVVYRDVRKPVVNVVDHVHKKLTVKDSYYPKGNKNLNPEESKPKISVSNFVTTDDFKKFVSVNYKEITTMVSYVKEIKQLAEKNSSSMLEFVDELKKKPTTTGPIIIDAWNKVINNCNEQGKVINDIFAFIKVQEHEKNQLQKAHEVEKEQLQANHLQEINELKGLIQKLVTSVEKQTEQNEKLVDEAKVTSRELSTVKFIVSTLRDRLDSLEDSRGEGRVEDRGDMKRPCSSRGQKKRKMTKNPRLR